ncbi:MAG: hypothetical protein ACRDZ4_11580 [Egibacteraceae bacterium]
MAWPDTGTSDSAARRRACQVLHGPAVQLDGTRRAHELLYELLADTDAWPVGWLGAGSAAADDAVVPAGEGVELGVTLSAHGLDTAAARLHTAHRRRRDVWE